jgi:hypothetical protein
MQRQRLFKVCEGNELNSIVNYCDYCGEKVFTANLPGSRQGRRDVEK